MTLHFLPRNSPEHSTSWSDSAPSVYWIRTSLRSVGQHLESDPQDYKTLGSPISLIPTFSHSAAKPGSLVTSCRRLVITYFNIYASLFRAFPTSTTGMSTESPRSFDPRGDAPFSCWMARRLLTASFTAGKSTSCRSSIQSPTASSCILLSVKTVYASHAGACPTWRHFNPSATVFSFFALQIRVTTRTSDCMSAREKSTLQRHHKQTPKSFFSICCSYSAQRLL